jgi:hypothetical protein
MAVHEESWGVEDNWTINDLSDQVYAARYNFVSGSPGYVGELFILQGSYLTGNPPLTFDVGSVGSSSASVSSRIRCS